MKAETITSMIAAQRGSSIWEPAATPRTRTAPVVTIPIEQELIELFLMPIEAGLTHREFHLRKEREILTLLERLTPIEAFTLERRLANPQGSDALGKAFARLVIERRQRVLAFLSDTRRRLAARR